MIKGVHSDNEKALQPDGYLRELLNGTLSKEGGVVRMEPGTTETVDLSLSHPDHTVVGQVTMPAGDIALFLTNGTVSEIFRYNGLTSSLLSDLGWSTPLSFGDNVQASSRLNDDGVEEIIWVDGDNPPRIFAVGSSPSEPADLSLALGVSSCPSIAIEDVIRGGGNLAPGSYQFALALVTPGGSTTPYLHVTPPLIAKAESGAETASVSVRLSVSNVPDDYNRIRVAVVREGSVVEVLPDSPASASIVYTGNESTSTGTAAEIIVPRASYTKAAAVDHHQGRLYLGGLESAARDLGYQKWANSIVVEPVFEEVPIVSGSAPDYNHHPNSYSDPTVFATKRGFKRGEVYAIYVAFVMKDGSLSKAYHVPGRAPRTDAIGGSPATGKVNTAAWAPAAPADAYSTGSITIDAAIPGDCSGSIDFIVNPDGYDSFRINWTPTPGDTASAAATALDAVLTGNSDFTALYSTSVATDTITITAVAYGADHDGSITPINPTNATLSVVDPTGGADSGGGDVYPNQPTLTIGARDTITGRAVLYSSTAAEVLQSLVDEASLNSSYDDLILSVDAGGPHLNVQTAINELIDPVQTITIGGGVLTYASIDDLGALAPGADGNPRIETDALFGSGDALENEFTEDGAGTGDIGAKYFHAYNEAASDASGMGYWENANETYPANDNWDVWDSGGDTGDSLQGEPVRHHRFPDARSQPFYTGDDANGSVMGFKLTNVHVPNDIKSEVVGMRVFYADRGTTGALCMDQALAFYAADQGSDFQAACYCLPYDTDDSWGVWTRMQGDFLQVHPPYGLATRRGVGSYDYVVTQAWIDGFDRADTNDFHGNYLVAFDGLPYYAYPESYGNSNHQTRRVKASAHIPAHAGEVNLPADFDDNFDNDVSESKIVLRTYTALDAYSGNKRRFYIVDLRRFALDLYNAFDEQELIDTGYCLDDLDLTETDNIFGGDTSIQLWAFKADYGAVNTSKVTSYFVKDTRQGLHQVVLESPIDLSARREGDNPWEVFYPASDREILKDTGQPDAMEVDDQLALTSSMSDNYIDFAPGVISSRLSQQPEIFREEESSKSLSGRIAYSVSDDNRVFLAENYHDLDASKGEIVRLTDDGTRLIIHTKRDLLITRGDQKIDTNEAEVYLGAGDPFSVAPVSLGPGRSLGIRWPVAAAQSEAGYFFANERGAFLLSSEGLKELSMEGIRREWAARGGVNFRVGYDPVFRRLLFTQESVPETHAYALLAGAWEGTKSYSPEAYLVRPNAFETYEAAKIYAHSESATPGEIYGTQQYLLATHVESEGALVQKQAVSLEMVYDVETKLPTTLYDDLLDEATVSVPGHTTGAVALTADNCEKTHGVWRFNKLRSTASPHADLPSWLKPRLYGRYFEAMVKYTPDSNKDLVLHDIRVVTRPAKR